MLLILLNWIYVFITTYALGFAFSQWSLKHLGYEIKNVNAIVAQGLIIATVYAQFVSIIGKVGLVANLILLIVSIIIYVINFRKMRLHLISIIKNDNCVRK